MALINFDDPVASNVPQINGSANFIDQLTTFLREINQILNNPMIANKLGGALPQQSQSEPIYNNPQTSDVPVKQIESAPEFNEQTFIKYLATDNGKKTIIAGIEKVKSSMGDLTLSQIITMLKQGVV